MMDTEFLRFGRVCRKQLVMAFVGFVVTNAIIFLWLLQGIDISLSVVFVLITIEFILLFLLFWYLSSDHFIKPMQELYGSCYEMQSPESLQLPASMSADWQVLIELINGKILELEKHFQDKKNASEYLIHNEKLVTAARMVSCIAREIEVPINSIQHHLEQLQQENPRLASSQLIQACFSDLNKVNKLRETMLTFTHQSDESERTDFYLIPVLEEVLEQHQEWLNASEILVYKKLSPDLGQYMVNANLTTLKQILTSLIRASVKSILASNMFQKRIVVDCYMLTQAQQILVRISDSSYADHQNVKARMKDACFIGNIDAEDEDLDLFISINLAREFGGVLTLDDSYQYGSRFLFYVPISVVSQHDARQMQLISNYVANTLISQFGADEFWKIVDVYLQKSPSLYAALREAYDKRQIKQMHLYVHDLKSNSMSLGLSALTNACVELDVLVSNWGSNPQPDLMHSLMTRLSTLESETNKALQIALTNRTL